MLKKVALVVAAWIGSSGCREPAPAIAPLPDRPPCITLLAETPPSSTLKRRLVAYFSSAGGHLDPPYTLDSVPVSKITHLIYAFIDVNHKHPNDPTPIESGATDEKPYVCTLGDSWEDDRQHLGDLHTFKVKNKYLKVLMSIGGGGEQSRHFSKAVSTPKSRATLVSSCVAFMRFHGFDGIDIDWEFPGDPSSADSDADTTHDRKNFPLFVHELRSALDAVGTTADSGRYLLTMAAPVGERLVEQLDLPSVHPDLDWLNLMTYNFHALWDTTNGKGHTGHHSPLYAQPNDPQNPHLTIDWIVNDYLAKGVPPTKLILGIPLYGVGWADVPDLNHGLYQTPIGDQLALAPRSRPSEPGGLDWHDIQRDYLRRGTRYWDDTAKVPSLYVPPPAVSVDEEPTPSVFISYDDPESACVKARYGNSRGLGGFMVWELRADVPSRQSGPELLDPKGSILEVLNRAARVQ